MPLHGLIQGRGLHADGADQSLAPLQCIQRCAPGEQLLHVHVWHLDRLEQRNAKRRPRLAFLVVIAQGCDHPDAAHKELFVFLDDASRYLSVLDAEVAERGFVAIFFLIQSHGDPVDHLVRTALAN